MRATAQRDAHTPAHTHHRNRHMLHACSSRHAYGSSHPALTPPQPKPRPNPAPLKSKPAQASPRSHPILGRSTARRGDQHGQAPLIWPSRRSPSLPPTLIGHLRLGLRKSRGSLGFLGRFARFACFAGFFRTCSVTVQTSRSRDRGAVDLRTISGRSPDDLPRACCNIIAVLPVVDTVPSAVLLLSIPSLLSVVCCPPAHYHTHT